MDKKKNRVLIVDDNEINRKIVGKTLSQEYQVLEADNGKIALQIMHECPEIGVVILDLNMPVMNGFDFLKQRKDEGLAETPVIVMTADSDAKTEARSLKCGAFDFVVKPVNSQILRARVSHAMDQNYLVAMERLEQLATHDSLTGLYNRNKMFSETKRLLADNPNTRFAMVRFDIDKFRLYNSAMGEAEGNRLLCYIADGIRRMASEFSTVVYGRIDADVFSMCEPFDEAVLERHVELAQSELRRYREDYVLDASFGIYIIEDIKESVESIFTKASMASDKCKNLFDKHSAYYETQMSSAVNREQEITNKMNTALEEKQFVVYIQPKYDINTDMPCGGEALVRWITKDKGMISPGEFIPVFEKNGFISKLDYYMWEQVCALIQSWIQAGKRVAPVSVNMSRVSMYNPHVADLLKNLIKKYEIPAKYLHLEVTESAYMSNPGLMKETISKLKEAGFTILMDDFGSGYSSLNTLKEISVDILKLDMKFMPDRTDDGRSEIIISSIVRMAGWLGMQVIAEGVETREQKIFLESVGCGYVQGYYYAKPMPVPEYEKLIEDKLLLPENLKQAVNTDAVKAVWSSDKQIEEILAGIDMPVLILETTDENIEIIRSNQKYIQEFGAKETVDLSKNLFPQDKSKVLRTLKNASETSQGAVCEVPFIFKDGRTRWMRMKVRQLTATNKSVIYCCILEEFTEERENESRLFKLAGMFSQHNKKRKMLIVDDQEMSRTLLKNIFEEEYEILEANNGEEAMELLRNNKDRISVILLDLIMPKMDGQEFLEKKQNIPELENIPTVVISAEDDAAIQLGMLKNGVNDYIVKPFDTEIVKQRVTNVFAYNSRFSELLREYRRSKRDTH